MNSGKAFMYITVVSTAVGILSACDEMVDRKQYFGYKPNCGEHQCFCVDGTAHCIGDMIMKIIPRLVRNISVLHAECYDFSQLNNESFKNIQELNLEMLHLRRNDIQTLSEETFEGLQHLSVVDISENEKLNNETLFKALRHLNRSNIVTLSLRENKIEFINFTLLEEFPNLQNLVLEGNWINSISSPNVMKHLSVLKMTWNQLRKKNSLQFCLQGRSRFPKLKRLYLGRNVLGRNGKTLQWEWTCLDTLEYLDLSNNTLIEVNVTFFKNLTSLRYLNLAANWIGKVYGLVYPPRLEEIDFSDNHLTRHPPNLCQHVRKHATFPTIKRLNFGRNYLQTLGTRWNCLPGIETLDFSRNDVSSIRKHTFSNFKNLKNLYLSNMISRSKTFDLEAFRSASLQNLDLRFNWIDFHEPQNQRMFGFNPNLTRLDVSYNNFSAVSIESIKYILSPLTKLEELVMQGIRLKTFPVEVLVSFTQLKVLNIDNNLIHTIEIPAAFTEELKNIQIQNISVARGLINTVTENAYPLSLINSLKYLNIQDNQFDCGCNMEWFRDNINVSGYFGSAQLLNWPENYVCSTPTSLEGHLFVDFRPEIDCRPINPFFVALIAIGTSLVVFLATASLIYWNRWYLKYLWYKWNKRKRSAHYRDPELQPILDQTQFDGYVVSNCNDNDFIHHPFRKMMEEKLGYKLHIWERDAKSGALVDVMLDAMYASKQIVVVVSNNLISDGWCKFQLDVAIDMSIEFGRNCLLLVVLEDVDFRPISKAWCVLLTKKPTAYWSDDKDSIRYKLCEENVKTHLGLPLSQINA
ncbi:toll-like receptor 3 [Mercenaria mercenaria]|uniref:toll-like receptor 3 n=1 Tax=Mercenaria mercenaria TaxID=6596 RepID=UPI00234ED085|nr:toll-like receptor 3 [Mercenaria mercenaria]